MKLIKGIDKESAILFKDGPYKSIKDAISRIRTYFADKPILADLDVNKNIRYYTGKMIADEVDALGDGLIAMGLKDAHVAIVADNSIRYILTDITVSNGVGVVTPIDKDAPEDLMATLLSKCDANAVMCSFYLVEKIKKVAEKCPLLKTIITIDKKIEGHPFYEDIVADGYKLQAEGKGEYKDLDFDILKPAKILFTSGTTGANKGVVLSGANLLANMVNCFSVVKAPKQLNTSMSILPMHHATEINTHIMARIGVGKLTYINTSMRDMMNNIKIFKPSVITIVPMIANAFYNAIWTNARKAGMEKKLKMGIKLCRLVDKFGKDIYRKLMKDVYAPFGGNLTQIVVGGAALNPDVVKGFKDLGIFVCNGYGITECGPLISMNAETYKDYRSVGPACPGLEAKILDPDEDGIGELCVKGKSISLGYYKDEEATKKVFYEDGFFNTGDLATIKGGKIYLTGRKKNVIVLENGKNVYPEEIETEIENSILYLNDIVVYTAPIEVNGVKKEILCCGVYIEDEEKRKDVEKLKADFIAVNEKLSSYKKINIIHMAKEPYERTSLRKIKRGDAVLAKHNPENVIKL